MVKFVLLLTSLALGIVAEPPVPQDYQAGGPSGQYGPPTSQFSGSPSSQYGAPGADRLAQNGKFTAGKSSNGPAGFQPKNVGPSSQYGSPFSGYGESSEEGVTEPANYEFKYDVEDQEYSVKFGHQETRQGDGAWGSYYVLLPDGRTQHVEYEADQDGYRPKISYEDPQEGYPSGGTNGGGQGYPSEGPNGGGQGYPRGGPNGAGGQGYSRGDSNGPSSGRYQ